MGQTSPRSLAAIEIIHLLALDPDVEASPFDAHDKAQNAETYAPRVLVVDDEKLVADSLSAILQRFHYDAVPFYDGETAIEAARRQCPDIVLSDVIMPKLNGVETALKIRELCPRARVVLLSGNAATADLMERARSEGHEFELLAKPIHPDELLRRLR